MSEAGGVGDESLGVEQARRVEDGRDGLSLQPGVLDGSAVVEDGEPSVRKLRVDERLQGYSMDQQSSRMASRACASCMWMKGFSKVKYAQAVNDAAHRGRVTTAGACDDGGSKAEERHHTFYSQSPMA